MPPKSHCTRLRLILGDQLNACHSWFAQRDDQCLYLIAELLQETGYVKHHIQKICGFFLAMEQFAAALQKAIKDTVGVTVAVEVADPGGVARSQGKAVRIVDNREAK